MKRKHFLTFHEGVITWYQSLTKTVQEIFRPIFLMNILVKILRKLLANWIQQCIKRNVYNNQVRFIPVVPGTFNIWKFIHLIHYINKIRASTEAQWVKNMPAMQETLEIQVQSWVGKILWRRKWQPIPVFLPEKSHGQRSQQGYSRWGHKETWLSN